MGATTPDVVDANDVAAVDRKTTPDVVDANDVVTEDKKTLLKPSVSSTWCTFLACSFGIKVFIFFRG